MDFFNCKDSPMENLFYPTPWTVPPAVSMPRNWWSRRYASTSYEIWQTDGRSSARPRSQWLIEREWYCSAHRASAIRQLAGCQRFSRRRSSYHRTWRQRFLALESADWRMAMVLKRMLQNEIPEQLQIVRCGVYLLAGEIQGFIQLAIFGFWGWFWVLRLEGIFLITRAKLYVVDYT